MKSIELLAPAKNYDAVRAAIDHGADAVYIGGNKFGARAAACNTIDDIALAVEYAHQYGARLYTTLNTLLFDKELAAAEQEARAMVECGVDALIVQDMAYARMGLGCELHASTQMCNTSVEGVRFLADLGFSRVVLERNLALGQIAEIGRECDVELEAFIHGAICVGHSGACYLSRSMTPQRSGNRGECSQPCRLSYDLKDEVGRTIERERHLLSVRDLNLSTYIGELLDSGVTSLKIEGRLKELSYSKNIVAHYRRVVDRAITERDGFMRSSSGHSRIEFDPNPAKSFSRGETTYMLSGKSAGVASFDTPKALGEVVGKVISQRGESLTIETTANLATGDGVCYITDEGLVGSNINRVEGDRIMLNRVGDIARGTTLYRNFDRVFEAAVESSRSRRTIGVRGKITSSPTKIELSYTDTDGYSATTELETELAAANNLEKMEQTIRTQLSKCGETIFEADEIDTTAWGGEFIPAQQLATVRRETLAKLRDERLKGATNAEHKIFVERIRVNYPTATITGERGVTNHLAEELFRDHGVNTIEPSYETKEDLTGATVMVSDYCIRREIGECLKERGGKATKGELYIERGTHRFKLDFDCKKCQMRVIKV